VVAIVLKVNVKVLVGVATVVEVLERILVPYNVHIVSKHTNHLDAKNLGVVRYDYDIR
jgi:hypothetical protein